MLLVLLSFIEQTVRNYIIETFKNFFNRFRIRTNADTDETFEEGRGKEKYIARYFI